MATEHSSGPLAPNTMVAPEADDGLAAENAALRKRVEDLKDCLIWCQRRLPEMYRSYIDGWLKGADEGGAGPPP